MNGKQICDGMHLVSGLFVGAGIEQQQCTVRVTITSGPNQRRIANLHMAIPKCGPSITNGQNTKTTYVAHHINAVQNGKRIL